MVHWGKGIKMGLFSFLITILLSLFLLWQQKINTVFIFIVMFSVIIIGILFDIIGTAATAATERELHAMAADRVTGATEAIYLTRHAYNVANFCNDMVGDICGTVGGAMATALAVKLYSLLGFNIQLVVVAFAAALTVGGKAVSKQYAIEEANQIIFLTGKFIHGWHAFIKWDKNGKRRNNKRNKTTAKEEKRKTT